MKHALDAAKLLYRSGAKEDARALVSRVWPVMNNHEEFDVLCASIEMWAHDNPSECAGFLDLILSGQGSWNDFWFRRSLEEQSIILEWHGQLKFFVKDEVTAIESLSRSASLGRDTPELWRILGSVYVAQGELELGIRYLRRAISLARSPEFSLFSGRQRAFGSFIGRHPLGYKESADLYLSVLLNVTRVAKSQRNLRSVRELLLDLIHSYPNDQRFMKIRLMMEQAIVQTGIVSYF